MAVRATQVVARPRHRVGNLRHLANLYIVDGVAIYVRTGVTLDEVGHVFVWA
jgi:hypothetical protein